MGGAAKLGEAAVTVCRPQVSQSQRFAVNPRSLLPSLTPVLAPQLSTALLGSAPKPAAEGPSGPGPTAPSPPAEPECRQCDHPAGPECGGPAEGPQPPHHQLLAPQPQHLGPRRAGPGPKHCRPHRPGPLHHGNSGHHSLGIPSSPHLGPAGEQRPHFRYAPDLASPSWAPLSLPGPVCPGSLQTPDCSQFRISHPTSHSVGQLSSLCLLG